MEDAHVAIGSLSKDGQGDWVNTGLFGVFDGHGGEEVANFCARELPQAIVRGDAADAPAALSESFFTVDAKIADIAARCSTTQIGANLDKVGCTACTCLVREDSVIVANAGDSRAVLSRGGHAYDLSNDHKPDMEREAARITQAGGFVKKTSCGPFSIPRVNGVLSVSRAMGDLRFKKNKALSAEDQIVSCAPDVNIINRHPQDEFLVLACDGVWDVMSSQDVVSFVRKYLNALRRRDLTPADVVAKVFDKCLSPDPAETFGLGGDNMTMILVVFEENSENLDECLDLNECPDIPSEHTPVIGRSDDMQGSAKPRLPSSLQDSLTDAKWFSNTRFEAISRSSGNVARL
jgi:protein phosphatase 1G